jgi:hypothetical protein
MNKDASLWDEAIRDAEDQLVELIKRESAMRFVIATLKGCKKRGELRVPIAAGNTESSGVFLNACTRMQFYA